MKCILALAILTGALSAGCRSSESSESMVQGCINNLRVIEAAKEQTGQDFGWSAGHECDSAESKSLVNRYILRQVSPTCPQGGQYMYNPIGTLPECSLGARHSSHRFPTGYHK